MESEIINYITDIVKYIPILLIAVIGWLAKYLINKSDKEIGILNQEIEHVKESFISREELRDHLAVLNKNIQAVEKNLSEKLDSYIEKVDLQMKIRILESKGPRKNKV